MYAINYIQKFVLITASECQYKFGDAISPVKWNSAIEIAEARFVMPLLGYSLYTDMCNAKNIFVTSGNIATLQAFIDAQYSPAGTITLQPGNIVNAAELPSMSAAYQLLWNSNLWKYVYECVYFVALSENYAQFTAQGITKSNPVGSVIGDTHSNSVGVGLRDIKWLEDRSLLDRINPLQTVLEQFICANKGLYPLYDNSRCECQKTKRTTSFLLDIYEDEDDYRHGHSTSTPPPVPVPAPFVTTCSITARIVATPDGSLFQLCNLQTIQAQYAPGNILTISHMVGKYVTGIMTLGSNPVSIPFYSVDTVVGLTTIPGGSFDNTTGDGFNIGDTFIFLYTETM